MRTFITSRVVLASLMLIMLFSVPAAGAGLEEFVLYPFVQYFTWEEFGADGQRLLKETGPQVGAGGLMRVDLHDGRLILQVKGELFGGNVDYDGTTQYDAEDPAVSEIPVNTDVDYFGTRIESDLGLRLGSGAGTIEPFFGLGYRYWIRDLNDSVSVDRNGELVGVGGYTEEWQSLYTRWGLRAGYAFDDDFRIFAEGGGKYPLYNENQIDYFSENDVSIKPGREVSPFAEIGFRVDRIRATLFYEGFRFSRSPISYAGFYQPKSDSDIFGITVGWCFK